MEVSCFTRIRLIISKEKSYLLGFPKLRVFETTFPKAYLLSINERCSVTVNINSRVDNNRLIDVKTGRVIGNRVIKMKNVQGQRHLK